MQMTFINPTRTITIGDDSGIGGDCLLFGHSSWLSQFEGYPIEFDSIEIGKSVSLAWRVFVLPGTKILDGAVVGANSLVRGEIPSRCLAVGFPARVVAKAPDFPKPVSDDDKRQILLNIQKEFVAYLRDSGFVCREEGSILTVSELTGRRWFRKARQWRMVITGSGLKVLKDTDADVVVSLWAIPGESRKSLSKSGIMWIDLENKERPDSGNELGEEFAQYLKRYGVRLIRIK
jgi:hypothetical protein